MQTTLSTVAKPPFVINNGYQQVVGSESLPKTDQKAMLSQIMKRTDIDSNKQVKFFNAIADLDLPAVNKFIQDKDIDLNEFNPVDMSNALEIVVDSLERMSMPVMDDNFAQNNLEDRAMLILMNLYNAGSANNTDQSNFQAMSQRAFEAGFSDVAALLDSNNLDTTVGIMNAVDNLHFEQIDAMLGKLNSNKEVSGVPNLDLGLIRFEDGGNLLHRFIQALDKEPSILNAVDQDIASEKIVNALVTSGVDVNDKNTNGETALDLLKSRIEDPDFSLLKKTLSDLAKPDANL